MIFLDTSAIYALADRADPNHPIALGRLQKILESGDDIVTHNYILLESLALLQARLGNASATKFAKDADLFTIEWVDRDLHLTAVRAWNGSGKRRVSFVDHVSFLVMIRRKIRMAFAFDADFSTQGFELYE